jgi:hypothetical protein
VGIGGLVAGVVMNAVEYGVNGVWLADRWTAEGVRLHLDMSDAGKNTAMIGWISTTFLLGFLVVWLYAAMRPRFGPGPGTAFKASIAAWMITLQMGLAMWFSAGFDKHLVLAATAGSLVALVIGAQVGAAVYKE